MIDFRVDGGDKPDWDKAIGSLKRQASDLVKRAKAQVTPLLKKLSNPNLTNIEKLGGRATPDAPASKNEMHATEWFSSAPPKTFTPSERMMLQKKADAAEGRLREGKPIVSKNSPVDIPKGKNYGMELDVGIGQITELMGQIIQHSQEKNPQVDTLVSKFNEACNNQKARMVPHLSDPAVAKDYASVLLLQADLLETVLLNNPPPGQVKTERQNFIQHLRESAKVWTTYSQTPQKP